MESSRGRKRHDQQLASQVQSADVRSGSDSNQPGSENSTSNISSEPRDDTGAAGNQKNKLPVGERLRWWLISALLNWCNRQAATHADTIFIGIGLDKFPERGKHGLKEYEIVVMLRSQSHLIQKLVKLYEKEATKIILTNANLEGEDATKEPGPKIH